MTFCTEHGCRPRVSRIGQEIGFVEVLIGASSSKMWNSELQVGFAHTLEHVEGIDSRSCTRIRPYQQRCITDVFL